MMKAVTNVARDSSSILTTRKAQRPQQGQQHLQQDDFDRAAVRLVEVLPLASVNVTTTSPAATPCFNFLAEQQPQPQPQHNELPLSFWTVQRMSQVLPRCRGREAGVFLEHPPLIRSIQGGRIVGLESSGTRSAATTSVNCGDSIVWPALQEDEEDTTTAEETVLWNDPEAYTSSSTFLADETVWNLSIVYSDTWQVPVLYFTVEWRTNGQPCSRAEIVQLLRSVVQQQEHDDEWLQEDFVSATEHPIQGTPCYFLHPCQTAERLRMIMCDDRETKNGNKNMENSSHSTGEDTSSAALLWSWFSLLLPALGFSIPPSLFLQVQTQLNRPREDNESIDLL